LIDTDPAFTQVRHLTDKTADGLAKKHTSYFSFGENFGEYFCEIPDDGFKWQPTRQPVVLKEWEFTEGNLHSNWTTVMQWDSYKTGEYLERKYGMKSASFKEYLSLPSLTDEDFQLAIGSATAPLGLLTQNRWKIVDPLIPTKSPVSYQNFICQSKAEWSVAKEGYTITNSGWFSERSTCYLASGRPVLVQDTGFSRFLPTGKGLLCFSSLDEVLEEIGKINSNYTQHCRWAREIAEEYFNSDKVLSALLSRIL
jgi:hypothetical protein